MQGEVDRGAPPSPCRSLKRSVPCFCIRERAEWPFRHINHLLRSVWNFMLSWSATASRALLTRAARKRACRR